MDHTKIVGADCTSLPRTESMSNGSQPFGSSGFAKYTYNFYATLHGSPSENASPCLSQSSSQSRLTLNAHSNERLLYSIDKEVAALTLLNVAIGSNASSSPNACHVAIGGRNCLRLLVLSVDQQRVIHDLNLFETSRPSPSLNSHTKHSSINTMKSSLDTLACGFSNGTITVYKVLPSGKASLQARFLHHNRCVNSLDFFQHGESHLLLSGSQDGAIKLWDLRSSLARPVQSIHSSTHLDPVRACQYSPHLSSKSIVLSVHDSGSLCKFDLRAAGHSPQTILNALESRWNVHTGPALSLHIHPTLEYVLTGGRDQKMCVWDYSDSTPLTSRLSPQRTINTHGPVRKVRWNNHPNSDDRGEIDDLLTDIQALPALKQYDFACLYLNDDCMMSIYNLLRKYIPQQTITTASRKPFLNFDWSKKISKTRTLWTLTKLNVFTVYQLDEPLENDDEISSPLNNLKKGAIDWDPSRSATLMATNQLVDEFDSFDSDGDGSDARFSDSASTPGCLEDNEYLSGKNSSLSLFGANGLSSSLNFSASLSSSPIERPQLIRAFTHSPNKIQPHATPLQRTNTLESTSAANTTLLRPHIHRNSSQTTQESRVLDNSRIISNHGPRFPAPIVTHASPYLIPIELPIPMDNDHVFDTLASNYLASIPQADMSLVDVCLANSVIAHDVGRHRECHMWRVLAVALQEEDQTRFKPVDESRALDCESISNVTNIKTDNPYSTIKQLTASLESESSQFTQYGTLGSENGSNAPLDTRNVEMSSVLPNIKHVRPLDSEAGVALESDTVEPLNSATSSMDVNVDSRPQNFQHGANNVLSMASVQMSLSLDPDFKSNPFHLRKTSILLARLVVSGSLALNASFQRPLTLDIGHDDEDVHNTSRHIRAISGLSAFYTPDTRNSTSYCDRRFLRVNSTSLSHSNHSQRIPCTQNLDMSRPHTKLSRVRQGCFDMPQKFPPLMDTDPPLTLSKLTTGLSAVQSLPEIAKPWRFYNLMKESLEYASNQGDIVLCSTLCMLFYHYGTVLETQAMEWLLLYIDLLQRRRNYVAVVTILNNSPPVLRQNLRSLSKNVDFRLYCSLCQTLLLNEKSNHDSNKLHGYWYCEQCLNAQPNCIYCLEPCRGLALVVSLKCGHRGHYGCLKEWFVSEVNVECPGGCDYTII